MQAIDIIRRLQRHRQWVNQRMLDTAKQMSKEQLHQRFAVGQGCEFAG